jgi:ssDNA-binding Zn-finger/Zn-ribbon topoisomerase 1
MELTEKVAYLKGLAAGMKLDTEKDTGKLFRHIIDILNDTALEIVDLQNQVEELADGLDVVSEDLEDVESIVYDEDWDDEDEDEDYDELDDEDDEDCYATTCPNCNETIYFDESILEDGSVECPNCGEKLEFDMDSLDEDDEDEPEE